MNNVDLRPYKIKYGYTDTEGDEHWMDADAETLLHAADVLYRLSPEIFEVGVKDINGKWKDVTSKVHHVMTLYVHFAYKDGRDFGPHTMREAHKHGR